jgi:hypothetical protein
MGLPLETALRVTVEESLAAHHTTNAIFCAERLLACSTSNVDYKHLLATAYLAAGETYKAYSILRPCSAPKNRFRKSATKNADLVDFQVPS